MLAKIDAWLLANVFQPLITPDRPPRFYGLPCGVMLAMLAAMDAERAYSLGCWYWLAVVFSSLLLVVWAATDGYHTMPRWFRYVAGGCLLLAPVGVIVNPPALGAVIGSVALFFYAYFAGCKNAD